jgi:hypothetical protein
MPKRRREEDREAEHPGKRQLARLDTATRAGVFEQLQRASGNRAVQEVLAGAQLQRDTVTAAPAAKSSPGETSARDWVLSLDGVVLGRVRSVAGGSVHADVVLESGPGRDVHKHVTSTRYDPVVLEVGLGMGKGFVDWIGDTFDQKLVRKTLILHEVDRATGQEQTQLELEEAMLTGVEVPQLAAGNAGPDWLKFTITSERVRRRAGSGAKVDAKLASDPLSPSTVRFEVSGIGPVAELKSVAPWTFKQGTKLMDPGRVREPELMTTRAEFGNLVVTLAEGAKGAGSGIAGFDAWVDDSLVKGNTGKDSERTAVLAVSSNGGRTLELKFSGVGIFAADQLGRAGGRRYALYVERAVLRIS